MQWVFETLSIDKDADVSTVRKAYAKTVKQCDQATEAERFQRIRQAYEWALQWAQQKEQLQANHTVELSPEAANETQHDSVTPTPVRRAPLPTRLDESSDLARQVFEEFNVALDSDPAALGARLARFAQDIRLTALDAKAIFEQAILIRSFADPMSMPLLDAACDLFSWETSYRHLADRRPDLVHRLIRQQTLRRLLTEKNGADRHDLEAMASTFASLRLQPDIPVPPPQAINANRLLDRYAAFKGELGERYGADMLTWWQERPQTTATFWAELDARKAQIAARPPVSQQRRQEGPGRWMLIFPLFIALKIIAGLSSSTHEQTSSHTLTQPAVSVGAQEHDPWQQGVTGGRQTEESRRHGSIINFSPTGEVTYRASRQLISGPMTAKVTTPPGPVEAPGSVTWTDDEIMQFAKSGDPEAQFRLGQMYMEGRGVRKDAALACTWWQLAAMQRHARAQYNLAASYASGEGTKKDYTLAEHWWRESAKEGYPKALLKLGWMYENGLGGPRSVSGAANFYRSAAEKGEMEGFVRLASLYETDQGVREDPVAAYAVLLIAAQRGGMEDKDVNAATRRIRLRLNGVKVAAGKQLAERVQSGSMRLDDLDQPSH